MAKSNSGKALVIMESGAKAKTVGSILGRDYRIEASVGHVRDLVRGSKGDLRYGIDIEHGYQPKYEVIKDRKKVLDKLREAAKEAEDVYLATDPDREGEAIAWHLAETLKLPETKTHRVAFNAITKSEVRRGMQEPRPIDMNLVNAQQARRVLDRLVGFSLSPLLWKKVTKGLSAGRVQSVAVRMVVEREKEIQAFIAEEFWRLAAHLSEAGKTGQKDRFAAQLVRWRDQEPANSSLLSERDIAAWPALADRLRAPGEDALLARLRRGLPEEVRVRLDEHPAGKSPDPDLKSLLVQALNDSLKDPDLFAPDADAPEGALAAELSPAVRRRVATLHERLQVEDDEEAERRSHVIEANRLQLQARRPELVRPVELRLSDEADVQALVEALADATYTVTDLQERPTKSTASPPFITSTMQQAASTYLRFDTSKTMRVAQSLYEGVEVDGAPTGLITYMRTDSVRLSGEAIDAVRRHIGGHFEEAYLPEKPNFYRSKKGAQEAHEAIRPTHVEYTPERLKPFLSQDQLRLYELIWRRFVASQMTPAQYLNTTATIAAGEALFEAKGRKVVFDGYTRVWDYGSRRSRKKDEDEEEGGDESQELPHIEVGQALDLHELLPSRHWTKAPPRYTEASLVRALEAEGIGRPSTYAPIVKTIQDRGYVHRVKRYFHATELGIAVTELLMQGFPEIMDYSFTAGMEDDLDHVEEGQTDWVRLLDDFYRPFEKKLEEAEEELEPLKGKPAPNGETCPECESAMVVRYSKNGAFLSCGRFPECSGTRPLDGEAEEEAPEVDCPACGAPMRKKRSRYGEFLACSAYPDCKETMPLDKQGKPVELPQIDLDCEKCGKPMVAKMGRRGTFVACTGYPDCKNTMPLDKQGRPVRLPNITGTCEKCGGEMMVRSSRRGPFLGCAAYPKCRNAKPIPKDAQEGDHIDFAAKLAAGELEEETPKKKASKKKAARKKSKKKSAKKKSTKKKSTKQAGGKGRPKRSSSGDEDAPDAPPFDVE